MADGQRIYQYPERRRRFSYSHFVFKFKKPLYYIHCVLLFIIDFVKVYQVR